MLEPYSYLKRTCHSNHSDRNTSNQEYETFFKGEHYHISKHGTFAYYEKNCLHLVKYNGEIALTHI